MPAIGNARALGAFGAKNIARLQQKAADRKIARDAKSAAKRAERDQRIADAKAEVAARRALSRRGSGRFRQAKTDYDEEQQRDAQAGPPPHKQEVINLGAASMGGGSGGGGGVSLWKNGVVAGSGASQIFPGRFSRGSIPGFGIGTTGIGRR